MCSERFYIFLSRCDRIELDISVQKKKNDFDGSVPKRPRQKRRATLPGFQVLPLSSSQKWIARSIQ